MKAGRNDPCPCGSGKKYKKCCLAKDRSREPKDRLELPEPRWGETEDDVEPAAAGVTSRVNAPVDDDREATPGAERDPVQEAMDALGEEFEACDYAGKTALFLKTLDTPELLADGMDTELLEQIRREAEEHGDCDGFEILVRAFQERAPETFAAAATTCISWLIDQRVRCGRLDQLAPLAKEIAAYAGADIDIFNFALDALAYHCDLPTLVEMMRIGWPGVKDAGDILPWGVDEFAGRAIRYELIAYCGQAATPRPDDPELAERLELYGEAVNEEFLRCFIESFTGRIQQGPIPTKPQGKWCHRICVEFSGYLVREQGIRPGKADLGSESLGTYLLRRLGGDLEDCPRLYDPGRRPQSAKRKSRRAPSRTVHVLCPDAKTLERYLVDQLHFLSPRYHMVAATMEIVPAWLHFLERRKLIDSREHQATFEGLAKLHADLVRLWKGHSDDPTLHEAAVEAWQEPQPSWQER